MDVRTIIGRSSHGRRREEMRLENGATEAVPFPKCLSTTFREQLNVGIFQTSTPLRSALGFLAEFSNVFYQFSNLFLAQLAAVGWHLVFALRDDIGELCIGLTLYFR